MTKFTNPTKVITGPTATRTSGRQSPSTAALRSSASALSFRSRIPRRSRRSRQLSRRLTRRVSPNSRATVVPFPRSPLSRTRSATATQNAPMMRHTQTATSSTLILRPLPVSWTLTAAPFWSAARFTAAFTAERPSHSTHSTPTATRVSPAV